MARFSFTTNIERRMPKTGEVACIDRMTSDYAAAHPFNVDNFIESVYQEFAGTEFEEPREMLRRLWADTLLMPAHGDPSVFPNKNGARRAAAMKVWHKAGDYWRKGFRLGDTLPDIVPMTKITRLDDNSWIALFPKDAYLIENGKLKIEKEEVNCEQPIIMEPSQHQNEPQQLDLFAFQQLQQDNERLQEQIAQMDDGRCMMADEPFARPEGTLANARTINQSLPRRQRKPRKQAVALDGRTAEHTSDINHQTSDIDRQNLLKAVGMVVAATVALLVIYETGLLIPLGLIGLATGGILK